jgi:hypothetical protein
MLDAEAVLDSGRGEVGVKIAAFAGDSAIVPPMRMANLPTMPLQNSFLSSSIETLDSRNLNWQQFYTDNVFSPRYYFFYLLHRDQEIPVAGRGKSIGGCISNRDKNCVSP